MFFVLIVFHETDGITNSKRLVASVTLLDFIFIEFCVDGAVNIVLYDELSYFRADIVLVTLLLCIYKLDVFLTQCTLPSQVFLKSLMILPANLISGWNVMEAKIRILKDKAQKFRFRLRAPNGEIVAVSEGYETRADCMNGIDAVKYSDAEIED